MAEVAGAHILPDRTVKARPEKAASVVIVGAGNTEVASSWEVMKLLENVQTKGLRNGK